MHKGSRCRSGQSKSQHHVECAISASNALNQEARGSGTVPMWSVEELWTRVQGIGQLHTHAWVHMATGIGCVSQLQICVA